MKTKLFAVLGLVIAMGVTACGNSGGNKSQSSAQQLPSSSSLEASSSSKETSSSQASSSFFSSLISSSQTASSSQASSSSEQKSSSQTKSSSAASSSSQVSSSSKHTHSWGEGVVTTEPGCETKGVRTFTCSCGETRTEEIAFLGHDYGSLVEGYLPSYFYDGSQSHYKCSRCKQYFDSSKQATTEAALKLEKAGDGIAISVNGVQKGLFTQTLKEENVVTWTYSELEVATDDVLSLTKPGDTSYKYQFFNNGNIDQDGKIISGGKVVLNLTATLNGFVLDVSGYKYQGLVVKVNDNEYPLNKVTYYENNKETYIYGYHYFNVGDVMTVVDNVNNITYDYDDLEDGVLWNVYDFEKGTNNEIVFKTQARFGIEFDRGGDKKISITKTFAPAEGISLVALNVRGAGESLIFDSTTYPNDSAVYESFTWYITHEKVINNEDITQFLANNGLTIFYKNVELKAGDTFAFGKEHSTKALATFSNIVDLRVDEGAITRADNDDIVVGQTGTYEIGYLPCCNSAFIYASQTVSADAFIMVGGNSYPLTKDANNNVTYSAHFEKSQYAAFMDSNYQLISPRVVSISAETPAHISSSSGYMIYFDKAGTFQLTLNIVSYILTVSAIELDPEEITGAYLIGSGGVSAKLISNPNYPNELVRENVEMKANSSGGTVYVSIYNEALAGYLEGVTLSPNSEDVAVSVTAGSGTMFYLIAGPGTYSFYLNKKSLILRIVKVS